MYHGGDYREKIQYEISQRVIQLKRPVAEAYAINHEELRIFEGTIDIEYMPNPFEIADYYKIGYKFAEWKGEMPSYLSRGTGIIYISSLYSKESYKARILCAHELGHYFLHDASQQYAMNNDCLNEYLPEEVQKEYEANVFSILLMPQIMAGKAWDSFSPKRLNREIYQKIIRT